MTAKRFSRCKSECKVKVYDEVTQEIIPSVRVVELLNELHEKDKDGEECYRKLLEKYDKLKEENEQLKNEIERITKEKENWAFISDCSVQVMDKEEKFKEDYLRIATNDLKRLQEENEQLKQFIDEIYEKFEYRYGMSIENTDWF